MTIIGNDLPNISSEEDKNKIRAAVQEAVDSMIRETSEKEHRKAIAEHIKETFAIKPKYFNKMVKVAFKQNFSEVAGEAEAFQLFYEQINGSVE